MHENEANQQDQRLLELRETKKMLLQQLQEKDQQLQEMNQQIQDYYQSQQSTTFCEYIEGCHETLCYELADQPNGRLETNGSTTNSGIAASSLIYQLPATMDARDRTGFASSRTPNSQGHPVPCSSFVTSRTMIAFPLNDCGRRFDRRKSLGKPHSLESTALNAKVKNGVAQSYNYLMESSTGLGILVTVQALVFLRVDWDNPGTLFYHIAAPAEDVAQAMASDAARGISEATTVGQYLAFTLMAMRHPRLPGQEARLNFIKHLPWKGRAHGDKNGVSDSSGYCTDGRNIRGQSAKNTKNQLSGGRKHRAQDWPYCSQRCLLGLIRGDELDWSCPNVTLHCQGKASEAGHIHNRHSISHSEWLSLLWDQFQQPFDVGITYEGVFGARGRFFKVTLLAYGYTFVSKGAVSAHVKHLQHEAEMYKQLEPIQGAHVPVFLGAIDLRTMRKNFWFDFGIHVVHMMFLSWAGHHIEQDKMVRFEIPRSRLIEQAEQAIESVHGRGVLHGDVRWENVLFNPETSDVMVIDFERAGLLDKSRTQGRRNKTRAFRRPPE
ncbi:hypothetical protein E4U17_005401 [Claviceps sp. LM77 group G4]|nr:hypothetical protein E4U17_005401 [Claviceps sp. LM77 group G4]